MTLTNPTFLVDGTTFATKNISSAASVYQYTVAADGIIYVSFAMTVAGNGDYVAYITHKWLTAGSTYTVLPKTTGAAASGETTISFTSGPIIVKNTDVIDIMVDGLAGDTSVGGIVRIAYYNFSVFQSSDTVANVTTVATVTNGVTVTTNNDKTGYSLTVTPPTANAIADQVWDEINATHAIAGSTGANLTTAASASGATPASLWAYASRTLTQTAAAVTAAIAGSDITILRGDTVTIALTGLGALTGYVSLDWTVKADVNDVDAAALLRVRKNASGLSDGLITINGATATTAAQASITIDDAALGNITITLTDDCTAQLSPRRGLVYDVQMITATTTRTLTDGDATIAGDVTRTLT